MPQPQPSLAAVSLDRLRTSSDTESSCCSARSGCAAASGVPVGEGGEHRGGSPLQGECSSPLAACPPAAAAAAATISHLPLELLAGILDAVLADNAAHERRPVVQFVGRQWLSAYRCAAYSRVSLNVGAALASLQRRHGLGEAAAASVLLHGLAARLPYASDVELCGVPPPASAPASGAAPFPCQLRWQLGELLLASLAGSTRLRRLSLHYLPNHVPRLLEQQAQRRHGGSGGPVTQLERLELHAVPAAELLRHLGVLRQQPLAVLGIADAACLGEADSAALAAALPAFLQLASLSLGGTPPPPACPWADRCPCLGALFSSAPALPAAVTAVAAALGPGAPAAAAPAAAATPPMAAAASTSLPHLGLVAAAAGMPSLQALELSLTFGRSASSSQQTYLERLGCVLHQQRRGQGGGGSAGSRVSVTVHENLQGDLSAVPVASCSLNLDWDSDSNPIEVWQCSTLHELRISAQLPLQAGQFRPARLAALQVLEVAGCCHIPAYFAAALCTMQQLVRLCMSDCQLEAVAAIPWQGVLPRLPALRELSIERCHGAVLLSSLWAGLAAAPRLLRLRITGQSAGGGLPADRLLQLGGCTVPLVSPQPQLQGLHPQQHAGAPAGHQPEQAAKQGEGVWGIPVAAAAPRPPAMTIPDCVALMQQLRCLDLGGNGLQALPDALAWCQQLTAVHLQGNRLRTVPTGVAALSALRKLDLSSNQVDSLGTGPFLLHLEELALGANLTLQPVSLPGELLRLRRLRRLALPLWWQLAGGPYAHAQALLLHAMPWLLLEHS
ncbi:hypothetical protein ABPG75_000914 [Micractinium tetrahymenae]